MRPTALLLCLLLLWPAYASGQAEVGTSAEAPPPGAGTVTPPVTLSAPEVVPETVVVPPPQKVEPLPPPHLEYWRRRDLLFAGVGVLAGVWIADRLLAKDLSPSWEPWLPVVGPWYLLGEQTDQTVQVKAFLVLDGLAQLSGVVLAVLGLVLKGRRMELSLPPRAITLVPGPRPGLAFSF